MPAFILGWFPDFADPDNWLTPFASCLQSPDNGVFFCDEEMDACSWRGFLAGPRRARQLYQEIGDLYAEMVPTLPLFWEPEFIIYREGVEGWRSPPPSSSTTTCSPLARAPPVSGSTDTIIIGTTDEVHSLDANDAYAIHDWK